LEPITIPFEPSGLGRVVFRAYMMTGDRKCLDRIKFKLDSGSDFTTISCRDLDYLGYSQEFLCYRTFEVI